MANGHGGPRTPANPAPVSGPGAHSKRTDGQVMSTIGDQPYGTQTDQMNQQRTAPMGAATPLPTPPAPSQGAPAPQPQAPAYSGGDFNAPTAMPNQPVTHGVPIGPGAGAVFTPQAPQPTGAMTQLLQSIAPTDNTGVLAQLYQLAQARGV